VSKRGLISYFLLGLLIYTLISIFQTAPGYMDSEYYTAGGIQLASGKGFQEPFIWNYLNNPEGIPAPSHLYWMPLASILAALGGMIGNVVFSWLRIPFIILAALLVPVTVSLSQRWLNDKRDAWLSGICALFTGVYCIYLTLPETFGLYMLGGACLLSLVGGADWLHAGKKKMVGLGLCAGLLTGLMHLSRADGILWLAGALIWSEGTLIFGKKSAGRDRILRIVIVLFMILGGYLLIMAGWYLRNLNLFGTWMPPGNSRVLWLTDYNQTYNLHISELNFSQWVRSGAESILISRWNALKLNLANLLVGQGGIVFLPLTVIAIWKYRKDSRIQFMLFIWLVTFLVMTIIFPFAGARGGYLHSSAACQLYLWVLVPVGLEQLTDWGAIKRGWNSRQAFKVFGCCLAFVAFILSSFFYYTRVVGPNPSQPVWNQSERTYREVDRAIGDLGITPDEIGAVNNPPGYYLATSRSSIVIPNGDIEQLLTAARRYNATYLLLEAGQVNLQELYANPGDRPELDFMADVNGVQVYRILQDD